LHGAGEVKRRGAQGSSGEGDGTTELGRCAGSAGGGADAVGEGGDGYRHWEGEIVAGAERGTIGGGKRMRVKNG
jgi:hypothetical protein